MAQQDILDAVAWVRVHYPVNSTRIYLLGHSDGGFMTMLMASRYPVKWARVTALLEPEAARTARLPRRHEKLDTHEWLVFTGSLLGTLFAGPHWSTLVFLPSDVGARLDAVPINLRYEIRAIKRIVNNVRQQRNRLTLQPHAGFCSGRSNQTRAQRATQSPVCSKLRLARSYRSATNASGVRPMSFAICRMRMGEMSRPP